MSRPHLSFWSRAAAVVLLGILWLGSGARSAHASGCHVPDRPVLGLTFAWETPSESVHAAAPAVRPNPLVRQTPCSEPIAAPRAIDVSAAGGALLLTRIAPDCAGRSERLAPLPEPRPSVPVAARLDRPPRAR